MSSVPSPAQLPLFPPKRCTKCDRDDLTTDDFYIKDKKTGRLYSWCKNCHNAMVLARQKDNPEQHAGYARRWRANNPERAKANDQRTKKKHRAEINAKQRERSATPEAKAQMVAYRQATADHRRDYNRAWREANAERHKATNRAYYLANRDAVGVRVRRSIAKKPDKYRAIHQQWKRANVAACRAMAHKRYARIRANGGAWTAFEWERLKAQCNWTCLMCQRREPDIVLCFDHIVPIDLGGFNIIANGQPLCRPCNSKKHRKMLDLRPLHLRYPT